MRICLSVPAAQSLHFPVLSGVGRMLPDAHPGTASLPFLTRVQEENKMRKLLGQETGRLCHEQSRYDLEKIYCSVLQIKNRVG